MFKKLLIANRGEIAVRILRAARELGVRTVAVHSEADARALHVRFADEALCIGPADPRRSYLNMPAILAAAEVTGADAIHPGYGFLSENAEFAELCAKAGLCFVGPKPDVMRAWGDKVRARQNAVKYGLPLLPGSGVLSGVEEALAEAERIGYPVLLKASGGGGGRGMRVVREADAMAKAFASATEEAIVGFKNPDVYLEKFIERPKHIEFQVLADEHGGVWTLGERECSLQRRHQKVIEEAPSPAVSTELRNRIGDLIRSAISASGYTSLGTIEFVMDERGELYFLEMNTRVQVEHPVTEMVTGLDLVALQIRVAAGEKLDLPSTREWSFRGHSIECRINAEDPETFVPWPGAVTEYFAPGGAGVRVDSGVYGGWVVPANYDSLLAKLIVHAPTRALAIIRMRRALDEFIVGGIRTNLPLHRRLLDHPDFIAGTMCTRTIEELGAAPVTEPLSRRLSEARP